MSYRSRCMSRHLILPPTPSGYAAHGGSLTTVTGVDNSLAVSYFPAYPEKVPAADACSEAHIVGINLFVAWPGC